MTRQRRKLLACGHLIENLFARLDPECRIRENLLQIGTAVSRVELLDLLADFFFLATIAGLLKKRLGVPAT